MRRVQTQLESHVAALVQCRRCPRVVPPPVSGRAIVSDVMIIGQAPGVREPTLKRPFAHTAGRTLFRWFEQWCGLDEPAMRERIYLAAVIRCFPGKAPGGSDRVPSTAEIDNCSSWMNDEFELLRPRLVIPVGKLAIAQFIVCDKLDALIGRKFVINRDGFAFDLIPLPHPSGASPWHKISPGRELLAKAMRRIASHRTMRQIRSEFENEKARKES
ncbi:MAG: uracil-DNA glycosylase [Verrucomicrobia bacterium]|nr:uracil-DNA glycosylase [Verrucomicrobiota bacterium]